MRRFKYGLNCQTQNQHRIGYLVPMGYHEVVPGDTISGTVDFDFRSDMTELMIMNRLYLDAFAFYVPYRLLDDTFPDFISQPSPSATIPTIADTWDFNFEKALVDGVTNSAFQRYTYNLIWNTFFRRGDETELALTQKAEQQVTFRPSTFHESAPEEGSISPETIPDTGVTTDIIREALNKDQFNKIRAYYGDRYTDFLAAVGVKANWSITDDPELIGKSMNIAKYQILDPTTTETATVPNEFPTGRSGGYWQNKFRIPIKKTFCPEHGFIAIYLCTRMEQIALKSQYPHLNHKTREQFWSPEYDGTVLKDILEEVWSPTLTGTQAMPNWEWLRKGANMCAEPGDDSTESGYTYRPNLTNMVNFKNQLIGGGLDDIFQGLIGTITVDSSATKAQFTAMATHKLVKYSPVGTRTGNPLR